MSKSTSKCVYRMTDIDGGLLYIGCSYAPMMRAQDHCKGKSWARDISNISVEWFGTAKEAQKAEVEAIKAENPLWNVHHKPKDRKRARGTFCSDYNAYDRSTWEVAR